jgi:hypothetical protein
MSTNSSEKNKYDNVPLPSLQRWADNMMMSSSCSSVMVVIALAFLYWIDWLHVGERSGGK